MAKSKVASFSTDQLKKKKPKFTWPWNLILKGAGCGLLVVGILALAAFIPDIQQTTLFGGISTNNFQYEWWTLLGVTTVMLGVAFCGFVLPILLLRGSRTRHYIIVFAAEFVVIGLALAIVSAVTVKNQNTAPNPGGGLICPSTPSGASNCENVNIGPPTLQ